MSDLIALIFHREMVSLNSQVASTINSLLQAKQLIKDASHP